MRACTCTCATYTARATCTRRLGTCRTPASGVNVLSVKWDATLQQFEVKSAFAPPPPEGASFDNAQKSANASATPVKVKHFDFVNIATGTFNEPRAIKPLEGFTGDELHARDWVGAREYKGKTVVVVGAGDSAEDIVLLLVKFGVSFIFALLYPIPLIFKMRLSSVSVTRTIHSCHRVTCMFFHFVSPPSIVTLPACVQMPL